MTQTDWNNWLIAMQPKWRQVHRDQVKRKAELIIGRLQADLDATRARLDEMINDELEARRKAGSLADITQRVYAAVSAEYRVAVSDIAGPSRHMRAHQARHTAAWLLSRLTDWTQAEIGKAIGRDRATAVHSINRVERAIKARAVLGSRAQHLLISVRQNRQEVYVDDTEQLIARITAAVAREYNVTPEALTGARRSRPVTAARSCWTWLVLELTGMTTRDLERRIGRPHTSTLFQRNRVAEAIEKKTPEGGRVMRLLMQLGGRRESA